MDCSVSTTHVDGIEVVHGCTCSSAKKYEDFILRHAEQIAEYLNKQAIVLRERAELIEVKEVESTGPSSG
jgi:hypothetical protein